MSISGYQGIPPRGKFPNKLREKIQAVNDSVAARIGDVENAQFYAVDASLFVQADGSISPSDMYDFLHLTASGCQKLAEPLVEGRRGGRSSRQQRTSRVDRRGQCVLSRLQRQLRRISP